MSSERGKVLNLFIATKGNSSKESLDEIKVDKYGVVNDKFYAKDIQRSVLISTIESYELSLKSNIQLPRGSLGENILIDYNPYTLPVGSKIKIGESLLEITQNCTLCKSLTKVNTKLPKILKDDRGIFAKVIESGVIKIDDKVYIL
ncbi:MAG: MOSC domain-containing protein [Sulfurovum sp.]|nr:MOSC domain-containing protein [Sulfurovaceae bacterium]